MGDLFVSSSAEVHTIRKEDNIEVKRKSRLLRPEFALVIMHRRTDWPGSVRTEILFGEDEDRRDFMYFQLHGA
jgi:hypothetical protein